MNDLEKVRLFCPACGRCADIARRALWIPIYCGNCYPLDPNVERMEIFPGELDRGKCAAVPKRMLNEPCRGRNCQRCV